MDPYQLTFQTWNKVADAYQDRFLDVEMFGSPPLTPRLSGLEVEYTIALIHSSEAGKREATIGFDVGQGTQDLGFRGEVPVTRHLTEAEIRDCYVAGTGNAIVETVTGRDPLEVPAALVAGLHPLDCHLRPAAGCRAKVDHPLAGFRQLLVGDHVRVQLLRVVARLAVAPPAEQALRHPALFELMFSPLIPDKSQYPELEEAATSSYRLLEKCVGDYLHAHGGSAAPHNPPTMKPTPRQA